MGSSSASRKLDVDADIKVVVACPAMDGYQHQPPHAPPTLDIPASPPPQFQSHPAPVQMNTYGQPMSNSYHFHHESYRPVDTNTHSSFCCIILILTIILIFGMSIAITVWLLFSVYIPEFDVTSLKVSNFRVTNTSLTGAWDADLSIQNWDKDPIIHFHSVEPSIFYKETLLATSSLHPFHVLNKEKYILSFQVSPRNETSSTFHGSVLQGLSEDLSKGKVVFGLRVAMKAVFKTTRRVIRRDSIQILCRNMTIVLSSPDQGSLAPGLRNTCLISVHKD